MPRQARKWEMIDHHRAHAAFGFFDSPFDEAVIISSLSAAPPHHAPHHYSPPPLLHMRAQAHECAWSCMDEQIQKSHCRHWRSRAGCDVAFGLQVRWLGQRRLIHDVHCKCPCQPSLTPPMDDGNCAVGRYVAERIEAFNNKPLDVEMLQSLRIQVVSNLHFFDVHIRPTNKMASIFILNSSITSGLLLINFLATDARRFCLCLGRRH